MKETRFKNTELGPIPVDWEIKTWGEVLNTFRSGSTPSRSNPEYWKNGTVKWVTSGELDYNLIEDTAEHITTQGVIKTNLIVHKPGTFLMAMTGMEAEGTRGRCAILATEATTNQSCLAIKGSEKLNIGYLFRFYQVWGNDFSFRFSQGSKQQSFTADIVRRLPIVVPPIKEQERIAEALSDVDALIAELGELIEKKRLVKQGTMQQLLTASHRLPGFSKPWVEYKLGEIGVFSKGKGISKAETTSEGLPCIRYGEIYTNHHDYIKSFVSYISQQTAMDSVALRKGQILFTASGETKEEIGKAVAFNLDLEAYAGGDIIIFTPTIQCDPIFMGYVMNTPDVNSQKSALGQGDAVVHIGAVALSTISVFIPDISEQRAIAEILTDMDNEIAELEAKREKYRAIKEGMMQQLLTGRIRLIDSTASSGTIDPSASINSDGDTPAAHTPPITYEPSTSYPQSLAAEPTIF